MNYELESIVLECNSKAMEYLKANRVEETLKLLKQAEEVLGREVKTGFVNRLRLLAITFSNFACLYKRRKMPALALKYLKLVVQVEEQVEEDFLEFAKTRLNVAVVYSMMGLHEKALRFARMALEMLKRPDRMKVGLDRRSLACVLVVVHYNIAVELEFLNQFFEAAKFYDMGYELALSGLGPGHDLTKTIIYASEKLNEKILKMKKIFCVDYAEKVNEFFKNTSKIALPPIGRRFSL